MLQEITFSFCCLLYTSLSCLPLASPASHDQQYNAAHERNTTHERRQRKRFRLLGSHLDGTDIDDLLSGRVGDALIRERDDSDHDKDDACQRVCFHFAPSFCCHPFHAAH
jgi:hypothetical protein